MRVRKPSPAQIRARAAAMVRMRRRDGLPDTRPGPTMRPSSPYETPLSREEVAFGQARGIFQLPDGEALR